MVNHLVDRWRGELWPAPDPHALNGAFGLAVPTVLVLIGIAKGLMPLGASSALAFVTLLGTVYFVVRLIRIPIPFEIAPSALSINDDQVLWKRVLSVTVDPEGPTLTVQLQDGAPLVLAADPDWHTAEDLNWLAARIQERAG